MYCVIGLFFERGMTVRRAAVVVIDLPWLPSGVTRVRGRAVMAQCQGSLAAHDLLPSFVLVVLCISCDGWSSSQRRDATSDD